jgi:hypothetical protein
LILAAFMATAGVVAWWVLRVPASKGSPGAEANAAAVAQEPAPAPFQTTAPSQAATAGSAIATVDQLSAPWSSKKFDFVNPTTQEIVPAMVIHLPGGPSSRSSAYWAFSLNAPYQTCELEFVTSLSQIASKYDYRASHPMVVSSCDGTLYDPLQLGNVPSGAWVRGQVVQGGGIRPPIAIDVRVQGRSVIVDRIE